MDFIYQLSGVRQVRDATRQGGVPQQGRGLKWAPPSAHGLASVMREGTIFSDGFSFVRDDVTGERAKLTIPPPSMLHCRGGWSAIDSPVYPNSEQFLAGLAASYAAEVARVCELGCRYLQFKDASLDYVNDPRQREHTAAIAGEPQRQHERYIEQINKALAGHPTDLAAITHMRWGSNHTCGRAARISSPASCSAIWMWTGALASATTSGPAGSRRCCSPRRARMSCSAW
jgi:5-methyltetrahydropteroyltriglutamate--homocysteine methyltransferase